jgi:hypothetical protein
MALEILEDHPRLLFCLVMLPISIEIFHYCMYYTKLKYELAKKISEWVPGVLILVLMIGITFYYA